MRQANTGSAKGARTRRGLAAAAAMAMLAGGAQAQAVLPDIVPLPFARPAESATGALDRAVTGSVAAYAPKPATATVAERLRAGLDALAAGDVAEARRVRDGLAGESIDRAILTWAIASSGDAAVGSPEIAGAMHALEGWPGAAALRANLERALHREGPAARTVVEAFAGEAPQTAQGAILLAGAHLELGDAAAARAAIVPLWRESRLEAREEQAIIAAFGDLIPQADHRFRMERMLYAGRFGPAERVAAAAGAEDLAKAFIAVARNDARAGELLDAVDEARRGAMHVFARSRHLRRTGRFAEAATVMLTAPTAGEALVDADAWWVERRVLSRELVDIGDIATAYRLAAAHAAESPAMAADAEFHAGWYAFRGLGDAATGARHFARIAGIAEGPISLARAHYWLGRAAEAGGPGDARRHYDEAAQYGTVFYGQLAAARLGRDTIAGATPEPAVRERAHFANRLAVKAIDRLEAAGHQRRADAVYRALAETLDRPGELALLADKARRRGNHFLGLRIAKQAALRGVDVGWLTHPVGAIPDEAEIGDTGRALAYAIARQESEFNAGARSGAGALGLLQLLPGTARAMAGKAGLPYSPARLTGDAGYNATLGAAYLDEQLARFDGSYVLTFAGYNAGPSRARQWMERYGDPRGKPVDAVVDWIERIPYTETRAYVQRVMENYQVYRMQLGGRMDIVGDLVHGR